jgi:hypothetical protein
MSEPFYKFPTLIADLGDLCTSGHSSDFGPSLIGKTYCFHWDAVCDEAKRHRMTLDRSLAFDLAKGFQQHRHTSPVLIWYGVINGMLFLWVTGNHTSAYTPWMSASAGYFETAQDYLRPNAVPFFYWDGQYGHRIYQIDPSIKNKPYWVQDLGSLIATQIVADTKETFARIQADPVQHCDYSAISPEIEVILRKGDSRVAITQALIELANHPLEQNS